MAQSGNSNPETHPTNGRPRSGNRIPLLDVARGVALLAMAVYHFAWDLENFGYLDPGTTGYGGWKLFARCIAGSFLFLVGVSLVLAHKNGIRWRPFFVRLAMIAAGAAAVTVATIAITPQSFVFFGILHNITVSSLLGLAFLRIPALLTAVAGFLIILLAPFLHSPLFDWPGLLWIGLSTYTVKSNDFVPVFPWFGVVLIGIAAGRVFLRTGGFNALASLYGAGDKAGRTVALLGRHGLAFYLLHQPVLMTIVFVFSLVFPAAQPDQATLYMGHCVAVCSKDRSLQQCESYCRCTLDGLQNEGVFETVMSGSADTAGNPAIRRVITACFAEDEPQTNPD